MNNWIFPTLFINNILSITDNIRHIYRLSLQPKWILLSFNNSSLKGMTFLSTLAIIQREREGEGERHYSF
jgi:hypothetical protein